jgi:hypothetical protein
MNADERGSKRKCSPEVDVHLGIAAGCSRVHDGFRDQPAADRSQNLHRRRLHMDYLTGFYLVNRGYQRREQRSVVFHSVPLDVDDDDSEREPFKIVLVFETLVDSDQNVTLALSLGDQLSVREGTPFRFGNGQHFMIRESLPQAGIDAFV